MSIHVSGTWQSSQKHEDGIDIFINASGNNDFKGSANGIPGNFMVLAGRNGNENYLDIETTTIVHEMGHLLGLLHMYHGCTQNPNIWPDLFGNGGVPNPNELGCGGELLYPWSELAGQCPSGGLFIFDPYECAEGNSNGEIAGDYIADTPPSHKYAERKGSINCQYVVEPIYNDPQGKPSAPIILTPDGDEYNPDVTNFISINPDISCRDHFTPNQVKVMKKYLSEHPLLQPYRRQYVEMPCFCNYDNIIKIVGSSDTPIKANIIIKYLFFITIMILFVSINILNYEVNDDINQNQKQQKNH